MAGGRGGLGWARSSKGAASGVAATADGGEGAGRAGSRSGNSDEGKRAARGVGVRRVTLSARRKTFIYIYIYI